MLAWIQTHWYLMGLPIAAILMGGVISICHLMLEMVEEEKIPFFPLSWSVVLGWTIATVLWPFFAGIAVALLLLVFAMEAWRKLTAPRPQGELPPL